MSGGYVSSVFFFSSRRRHTRLQGDWSSDVCSSDLMNFDSDTNVVDVAVRRLRSKVDEPFAHKLIHTVRGVGYVLEEIGRASCRERSVDLGGRRIIKKKKKKSQREAV